MEEGEVAGENEIDTESSDEIGLVAEAGTGGGCFGRWRRGEEGGGPWSGHDIQYGEEGVDEADFFV